MMRITNSIIANNSKYNINSNKISVDTLNTQMTDQKKIHSPSEDPVIAIRALRLRGSLAQINQYYEKNIPDALSWMDVTENALINMKERVAGVSAMCNKGANDPLAVEDRQTVLTELKEMQKQIYSEGNADYAGRTLFTGYKTGSYLTFQETDNNSSYTITEKFDRENIVDMTYINKSPNIVYGNMPGAALDYASDMPSATNVTKINLGYKNLVDPSKQTPAKDSVKINYTTAAGQPIEVEAKVMQLDGNPDNAYNIDSATPKQDAYFIPETGELILSKDIASKLRLAKDISFTYDKTGFDKGELRPEHYYDCTMNIDKDGEEVELKYTKEPNPIEYTVSFNQTININVEASDVFNSGMQRSMDEMIEALQSLNDADKKIADVEKMMAEKEHDNEADQAKLQSMLDAAKKERDLLDDKVQKLFERNIGVWQGYLDTVDLAITDSGSRISRVELTESRMASQKSTFEKLKSTNEDRELSEIIVDYTSAYTAYQASLQATSKALQQTLLNYL